MHEIESVEAAAGDPASLPLNVLTQKPTLDKLDAGLWELFKRFYDYQRGERRVTIVGRYEQGRLLLLAEKRHRKGIMAIGRAAGLSTAVINEMQLVARRVSEEEIATFIAAADRSANPGMGWSHLVELSVIESPEVRAAYIQRTSREGLTLEDLRRILAADAVKVFLTGSREGTGRPFSLPSDPVGVFERLGRQSAHFQRLLDQAAGSNLVAMVLETPVARIGYNGLARMRAGLEALEALRADVGGRIDVLRAAVSEIEDEVAAIDADALAGAAAADDEREARLEAYNSGGGAPADAEGGSEVLGDVEADG